MSGDDEFLAAYTRARVDAQRSWYLSRVAEYESAGRQAAWIRHAALGGSALCGGLGAIGLADSELWGVVAASLAALAALITAWSDTIGFKLNAALYSTAVAGLDRLGEHRPVPPHTSAGNVVYVDAVETVLRRELEAWTERWSDEVQPGATGDLASEDD